jgi:hypothetical protein
MTGLCLTGLVAAVTAVSIAGTWVMYYTHDDLP